VLTIPRPARCPLFPYTTLFRSTRADLREHDEAVQAGKEAGQWVGHVLQLLGKARGASTWDMLGGGAFADAVERHHLVSADQAARSEEHTSELQSRENLVCRLLL